LKTRRFQIVHRNPVRANLTSAVAKTARRKALASAMRDSTSDAQESARSASPTLPLTLPVAGFQADVNRPDSPAAFA